MCGLNLRLRIQKHRRVESIILKRCHKRYPTKMANFIQSNQQFNFSFKFLPIYHQKKTNINELLIKFLCMKKDLKEKMKKVTTTPTKKNISF